MTDQRPIVAGEGLLHPLAIAALGTLIANDHLLKHVIGGPITGKLSDVAGLIVFPLVLVAVWELACLVARRSPRADSVAVHVAVVATVIGFAAVKLDQRVADLAASLMAAMLWPVHAAGALAAGRVVPDVSPGVLLADPGDLVTLPAVLLAVAIAARRGQTSLRVGSTRAAR